MLSAHHPTVRGRARVQAAAVMLGVLSAVVVFGEATIVSPVDLSPLSLLIKSVKADEFSAQLFTLVPLVS